VNIVLRRALVCAVCALAASFVISRVTTEKIFLFQLFIGALLVRMVVGTLINLFELQDFFGGDAYTYDYFGSALIKALLCRFGRKVSGDAG
jgi:hypothetical protein